MKELALRLVAGDAASGKPGNPKANGTFGVCETLRGPLSRLAGVGGFRSLLSRALALGGAEVPWLRSLQVKADGCLEGLGKLGANLDSRALAEGEAVLVAQFLGLLVTFIGPALTLRLLRDIWPKMIDLEF